MTRDEFEALLEEAFMEGYNNAYDEIEEVLDEDYIEIEDEDMDFYNEESHLRNFARQFSIGGIKHARSTDMGKKYAKEARKAGLKLNPRTFADQIADKKNRDKIDEIKNKMEKSDKFKKFAKFVNKNNDKLVDNAQKKIDDFKKGKLKDLKSRIALNALRNKARQYGGDL